MVKITELIKQELEELNEEQLRQVADYIAFLKFHARCVSLQDNESKLAALYGKFAEEDQATAEEGINELDELLAGEIEPDEEVLWGKPEGEEVW